MKFYFKCEKSVVNINPDNKQKNLVCTLNKNGESYNHFIHLTYLIKVRY